MRSKKLSLCHWVRETKCFQFIILRQETLSIPILIKIYVFLKNQENCSLFELKKSPYVEFFRSNLRQWFLIRYQLNPLKKTSTFFVHESKRFKSRSRGLGLFSGSLKSGINFLINYPLMIIEPHDWSLHQLH